jgi:hypothetical protein
LRMARRETSGGFMVAHLSITPTASSLGALAHFVIPHVHGCHCEKRSDEAIQPA